LGTRRIDVSVLPAAAITSTAFDSRDVYLYGTNGGAGSVTVDFDLDIWKPAPGQMLNLYNDSNAQVTITFTAPNTFIANNSATLPSPSPLFDPSDPVKFAYFIGNGDETRAIVTSI
jgi:hypothetical protein